MVPLTESRCSPLAFLCRLNLRPPCPLCGCNLSTGGCGHSATACSFCGFGVKRGGSGSNLQDSGIPTQWGECAYSLVYAVALLPELLNDLVHHHGVDCSTQSAAYLNLASISRMITFEMSMTADTERAVRVLKILRLQPTWPLIRVMGAAIREEADSLRCPLDEAAWSLADAVREIGGHGRLVDVLAQIREQRAGRVPKRVTSKEQRKAMLGHEFIEDCPACSCGNLWLIHKRNGTLFVGCDCFRSECKCKFSFAVPDISLPESEAGMTEVERAKAKIAAAPRCLNHNAPMTMRTGPYGRFAACTVNDCGYRKGLQEVPEFTSSGL